MQCVIFLHNPLAETRKPQLFLLYISAWLGCSDFCHNLSSEVSWSFFPFPNLVQWYPRNVYDSTKLYGIYYFTDLHSQIFVHDTIVIHIYVISFSVIYFLLSEVEDNTWLFLSNDWVDWIVSLIKLFIVVVNSLIFFSVDEDISNLVNKFSFFIFVIMSSCTSCSKIPIRSVNSLILSLSQWLSYSACVAHSSPLSLLSGIRDEKAALNPLSKPCCKLSWHSAPDASRNPALYLVK